MNYKLRKERCPLPKINTGRFRTTFVNSTISSLDAHYTPSDRIKLREESATDEGTGMQRGYEQIGDRSTATKEGGWVVKVTVFVVQDEKTTLQAERPNLNPSGAKHHQRHQHGQ